MNNEDKIKKVSIIVSRGSLDGVYPGLIMANGARMEGIEANLFFTFLGLHSIVKKKMDQMKIATVDNPGALRAYSNGAGMPTWLGGIPGISWLPYLRLQGHRRHVQTESAGFLPTGGQGPYRRRILRGIGWSPNHLHLNGPGH